MNPTYKLSVSLILLCAVVLPALGQPNPLWTQQYPSPGDQEDNYMVLMPDGGACIATDVDDTSTMQIIRTDADGDLLYAVDHDITGTLYHLEVRPDGKLLMLTLESIYSRVHLVDSADGAILASTLLLDFYLIAVDMVAFPDNSCAIFHWGGFISRLDSNLNVIWQDAVGRGGERNDMLAHGDDNMIVGVQSMNEQGILYLEHINDEGEVVWQHPVDPISEIGAHDFLFSDLAPAPIGFVALSHVVFFGDTLALLDHYTFEGERISRTLTEPVPYTFDRLEVDPDGNYLLYNRSTTVPVHCFNEHGVLLWTANYGPENAVRYHVLLGNDDDLYITGISPNDLTGFDTYLTRTVPYPPQVARLFLYPPRFEEPVPPDGELLTYAAYLTSHVPEPATAQVWGTLRGPAGETHITSVLNLFTYPGQRLFRTLPHWVYGGMPGGEYTFMVSFGVFPGFTAAMDSFTYVKEEWTGAEPPAQRRPQLRDRIQPLALPEAPENTPVLAPGRP